MFRRPRWASLRASLAGVAVAQGGLTAILALSGTFFNVNIRHLEGDGFSLFVDSDKKGEEEVPTARLKMEHLSLTDVTLELANLTGDTFSAPIMSVTVD